MRRWLHAPAPQGQGHMHTWVVGRGSACPRLEGLRGYVCAGPLDRQTLAPCIWLWPCGTVRVFPLGNEEGPLPSLASCDAKCRLERQERFLVVHQKVIQHRLIIKCPLCRCALLPGAPSEKQARKHCWAQGPSDQGG